MTDYYVDEDYEGGYDDGEYYLDEPDPPARHRHRRLRRPRYDRRPNRFDEVEGRTTWMYIGGLTGLFLVLVFFSWACDVESSTPTDLLRTGDDTSTDVGQVALRLGVTVNGDIVRLSGAVPDEAAHQQILAAASAAYGQENVIDELIVDGSTTVDGGVLTVAGSVVFGDTRPAALRDTIVSSLGLSVGDYTVEEGDAVVQPVDLLAEVDGDGVHFSGVIPDDGSAIDLTTAGEAIWGQGTVDVSGLTAGDTTWAGATVTVTGATAPGDQRYEALAEEIRSRFDGLAEVDTSGVEVDTGPEAVAAVQSAIDQALADQPITFGQDSSDIDSTSDELLASIADQLGGLPGVAVEVVGHTDDLGPADQNLTLSQLRAEAVVTRLVELGVDQARFTARGAGESEPIADNGTSAGRAQNRRIELVLG